MSWPGLVSDDGDREGEDGVEGGDGGEGEVLIHGESVMSAVIVCEVREFVEMEKTVTSVE